MTTPHEAFKYSTPDTVAECWEGVFDAGNLYERLWDMVPLYSKFDREECGPADVVGLNSVASFWDRFTEEEQIKLNEIAIRHDAEWAEFEKEFAA